MAVQAPAQRSSAALNAAQFTLLVAVCVAVIGKGAFYRQGQVLAGGVLALALVVAIVSSRGRLFGSGVPRSIIAVVSSLFALGLWAAVRGALAGDGLAGVPLLAFAAALSAGFVTGHLATPPQRRTLRQAMVALGAASALSGWVGFVWRIDSLALPGTRAWRAAGTLTYENALACLLAVVAVVAVAALVERETPGMAAGLCVLLVGAAATQSRAGALALLCGAATVVAYLGWRPVLRVAWRPAVGAMIATLCLVPSASVTSPPRPLPAIIGLCVGVVVAAWPGHHLPVRAPTAVGVAVIAVALAGVGLATRLDADGLTTLTSRVNWSSPHRVSQHRVAVAELAAHPIAGTGPGQAELRWRDATGQALRARFVHNEYLQVAVELGLVGGALLLVVLAAIARALWFGRAAGGAPWAGVAAAVVATAVHGGLDFVWHLPVIPFITLLLAGTATVPNERGAHEDDHPNT